MQQTAARCSVDCMSLPLSCLNLELLVDKAGIATDMAMGVEDVVAGMCMVEKLAQDIVLMLA